jgi:hypothetical protein
MTACGEAAGRGPITIEPSPAAIEVRGVEPRLVRALASLSPDDSLWQHVFVTRVAEGLPPVIGKYDVDDGRIRFRPRFPLTPGTSYTVKFDGTFAARLTGESDASTQGITVESFSFEAEPELRNTRVVSVHPTSDRIPENILRWYVEFSAPMTDGDALQHVKLIDEAGREVREAFLGLDQELWDPDRRRLTLLFDPGRVKRGIRTNVEAGAPLIAGRRYRIEIDAEWRDANGARLASGLRKDFEAIAADRTSPDPASWAITAPRAGTRDALRIALGESIDHALALRAIEVHGPRGAVRGIASLRDGDTVREFVPDEAWRAGDYQVRVAAVLEDVAGNNLQRVFDADRSAGAPGVEASAATSDVRTRSFSVR